jgi:hypothetical protein
MPCSTFIKQGIFCLIGLAFSYSFGQKTIHKSFIEEGVDQIFIDAKDSFEVVLQTTDTNSLTIKAEIEGEYSPNQLVNVFTDRNLLTIEPSFNAGFVMPNDKLSAHKVLSVSLFIEIPQQFKVKLVGNSTNTEIHGDYKDLRIELNDGNCTLYQVESKATVHTIKGSIKAYVDKATIDAHSTYGTLDSDSIPLGKSQLNLKSQIGHIQLIKANK